jgi:crotonobetainyl-CoA:carnitine CoA-transferase CaiB-like acyl-CoA transferase
MVFHTLTITKIYKKSLDLKQMDREEIGWNSLSRIRILDFTDETASFCSKLLADIGAKVIKVERPKGDRSRRIGPFFKKVPSQEESLFFWYHNTNKEGITLNIEKEEGRNILLKLLQRFDVFIESYPPGYLERLGLGYKSLSNINPKIIMISITPFGKGGPRSHYKSSDLIVSAFGGQMAISGFPKKTPLKPYGEQSFYLGSLYGAIAVLLALIKREKTGKGDHIDISIQEAIVSTLDQVLVRYFSEKMICQRRGGISGNYSWCILPCKDGHILITPFYQWDTLIEWMDSEGMAEDLKEDRWKDEIYRIDHFDHIFEVISRWTLTHTKGELFEIAQLMRLPWAPIFSPNEAIKIPQLKERKFFINVYHPEIKADLYYPGSPYQINGTSMSGKKRAPFIGENNFKFYNEELGLSEKEIKRLSSLGVI